MAPRRRVYDARDVAIETTERFNDRPWEYQDDLSFTWPTVMQNVGDSLAVAYSSNKWKKNNGNGKRESELYKHIADSRNRVLIKRGLLKDYYSHGSSWPVIGPKVRFGDCPLPRHFSILGLFEEASLQLYTSGTNRQPGFSEDPDEGIVKVTVRHGILGAGEVCWSEIRNDREDEPFLFVYTESQGVLMVFFGEELEIHKDGIAG